MIIRWNLRSFLLWTLLVAIARTEEVFNTTPPAVRSNFSCLNRPMGFYADVEENCRVYYTCDDHGNKFSYRCPDETAFRQDALICDHAHLVDCQTTTYPFTQFQNDTIDKTEKPSTSPSVKSPIVSTDSFDDHRLSFSRSFQVIRPPDKTVPNKIQPGFVLSSSVFLRDQDPARDQDGSIAEACRICHAGSKNRVTTSTARALPVRSWNHRNDKPSASKQPQALSSSEIRASTQVNKDTVYFRRSFGPISSSSSSRAVIPAVTQPSPAPFKKSPTFVYNNNHHPYSETLRSIQANAVRTSTTTMHTTEIPVYALTVSLKPLVPNELEYDPYYPKQPTSTEAYYTPSGRANENARFPSSSPAPQAFAHSSYQFEIPPVLPDLNTLEDLVDRRKFFYIPRANAKSI